MHTVSTTFYCACDQKNNKLLVNICFHSSSTHLLTGFIYKLAHTYPLT